MADDGVGVWTLWSTQHGSDTKSGAGSEEDDETTAPLSLIWPLVRSTTVTWQLTWQLYFSHNHIKEVKVNIHTTTIMGRPGQLWFVTKLVFKSEKK